MPKYFGCVFDKTVRHYHAAESDGKVGWWRAVSAVQLQSVCAGLAWRKYGCRAVDLCTDDEQRAVMRLLWSVKVKRRDVYRLDASQ